MSGQAGAPRARYFSKEPKESLLIRFSTAARKYWFIYLLAIPGLLFLLVFSYAPMYGVVLAFKDFKMNLGVMGSPWVGLYHYRELFADPAFIQAFKNTVIINIYNLIFGFTFNVFLALMINELQMKRLKSVVQTCVYLPYFLSWVIFAGLVQVFLQAPVPGDVGGVVNQVIQAMGGEPIDFMKRPEMFRGILVITNIIKTIVDSDNNKNYHVHAIVAPAIAGQFQYAKAGQLISAIRELGFYAVEEVALGADIVAYKEAQELQEKGFLTSSCCPAFVKYIKMKFPQLAEHISHNLSPMAETGKLIKEQDPDAKIVFIGPCTAKKGEVRKPEVHQYVDYVMTFEELQAMIDSKDIAVDQLPETELDTATYYGRVFARTGGLSEAVTEAVREQKAAAEAAKADAPDGAGASGAVASGEAGASGKPANGDGDSADSKPFVFDPIVCDGIDSCKTALLRASKGLLPNNFIEGMVCTDGCIGGAACLSHGNADKRAIDNYGKKASHKEIRDVL